MQLEARKQPGIRLGIFFVSPKRQKEDAIVLFGAHSKFSNVAPTSRNCFFYSPSLAPSSHKGETCRTHLCPCIGAQHEEEQGEHREP